MLPALYMCEAYVTFLLPAPRGEGVTGVTGKHWTMYPTHPSKFRQHSSQPHKDTLGSLLLLFLYETCQTQAHLQALNFKESTITPQH